MKEHTYELYVDWTGNQGEGTKSYTSYRRDYNISANGKPDIAASSDPSYRGDPSRYNPEELLVASISGCHMLWYLHLCSANRITVLEYRDAASGVLEVSKDGSGRFVRVLLKPSIRITAESDRSKAMALHEQAHEMCFIAQSVNFPIEVAPEIR